MRFRVGTKQQREETVYVQILKLYDPVYHFTDMEGPYL